MKLNGQTTRSCDGYDSWSCSWCKPLSQHQNLSTCSTRPLKILLLSCSTWLGEALLLSVRFQGRPTSTTAATAARFGNNGRCQVQTRRGVTELSRSSDLCCNAICFRSACAWWQINLTMPDIQVVYRWKCCQIASQKPQFVQKYFLKLWNLGQIVFLMSINKSLNHQLSSLWINQV